MIMCCLLAGLLAGLLACWLAGLLACWVAGLLAGLLTCTSHTCTSHTCTLFQLLQDSTSSVTSKEVQRYFNLFTCRDTNFAKIPHMPSHQILTPTSAGRRKHSAHAQRMIGCTRTACDGEMRLRVLQSFTRVTHIMTCIALRSLQCLFSAEYTR